MQYENDCFQAENSNVKMFYKELYDSIKVTRDKHNEKIMSLLNEIKNLKTQVKGKMPNINCDNVVPKVSACSKYAIDVVPIPHPLRNNRSTHQIYLTHLKDSLDTLREIVEEDRIEKPLNSAIIDACILTKRSQELLEFVIGTCPKIGTQLDSFIASSSMPKNNHVTFDLPLKTSEPSTSKPNKQMAVKQSNAPIINSTGVKSVTKASGSKSSRNTRKDRTTPAKSAHRKKVEDHLRNNKLDLRKRNRVNSGSSSKRTVINSNSNVVCKTCNDCLISSNHDQCVVSFLMSSKQSPVKKVWRAKQIKQYWKPTWKRLTSLGY